MTEWLRYIFEPRLKMHEKSVDSKGSHSATLEGREGIVLALLAGRRSSPPEESEPEATMGFKSTGGTG